MGLRCAKDGVLLLVLSGCGDVTNLDLADAVENGGIINGRALEN